MRKRWYINDGWEFSPTYTNGMEEPEAAWEQAKAVRLPHTVAETPFHYFDESVYQKVSAYRRVIYRPAEWAGKSVLLTVEAAAHVAELFLNGEKLAEHACGYTAFTVDLSEKLQENADNVLVIKVDSRESLNIPPFGHVIDYMTYGGIYREVYLEVKEKAHIADVFPQVSLEGDHVKLDCQVTLSEEAQEPEFLIYQSLYTAAGELLTNFAPGSTYHEVKDVELWDVDQPVLYRLRTELWRNGACVDAREDRIGFREAEFRGDGFYLNGKKLKLRGLDRHQCYPYVGYAMPASLQRWDAELLKEELGLNAVRTSHYPQSHHFLDRCDELGLLVFTEIPGWQHIGDEDWKEQAVENTREMVLQYRNHPSIILWGVRINESLDDDGLYRRTNRVARELDPSRQTGGVRYIQKSSLLEDVYAYNDFSHTGKNGGCLPRRKVTPDLGKGYLISEYNGHMFPTKPFDDEDHRTEHMLRHARVMDAYYGEADIAGGFGWCMFDYNTHKDFGSGDRICYHGVMDSFRNRKPAGYLYSAQQEEIPVLEVSSTMDIGEHPAGVVPEVYAMTNVDGVRVYKNGVFVREYRKQETPFPHLPHGPIRIDDLIGERMEKEEGLSHWVAEDMKAVLRAANRFGMTNLPLWAKLRAAKCLLFGGMTMERAVELYGKYMSDWGGTVTNYRFEAVKDGEVVAVTERGPGRKVALEITASHEVLEEHTSYDVAAVRIRAVNEKGNLLPFYQEPVHLTVEGPAVLIGPNCISLKGGMGGTYIKTLGESGTVTLTLQTAGAKPVSMEFQVEVAGA